VVAATAGRYREALKLLTGSDLDHSSLR
jgi:hypothetical protein